MLRFLLLALMASNGLGFSLNVNSVVDRVLPVVNCLMRNSGKSVLQLQDLHLYFGIRILLVAKTSVHLDCSNGTVQSLDTLERVGDVNASVEGGKISVEGKLRLKELSFGYTDCNCRIFHRNKRTPINATVSSHSIKFKASYIQEGNLNCNATIDSLEVDDFGEVQVTSGHLAPRWALKRFLPIFRIYIIKEMKSMLLDEIPEINFCKMLHRGNTDPDRNSTDVCYT